MNTKLIVTGLIAASLVALPASPFGAWVSSWRP